MTLTRPRERFDGVKTIKSGLFAVSGFILLGVVLLVLFFVMLTLASRPGKAQIQVPPECAQLAAREGFPTDVMTKVQATLARIRMKRLSDNDPIVRPCRAALAQLKAMAKEMKK